MVEPSSPNAPVPSTSPRRSAGQSPLKAPSNEIDAPQPEDGSPREKKEAPTSSMFNQSYSIGGQNVHPFSPSMLKVKKRHTRILGTINKKANKEFID